MKNMQNKCILRDNNGIITSDYGFTYVMLSDLLHSGNYHDYIKDGDWIELTLANGDYFKLYANIDTYYGEGPDDKHKIGHHIDFISKDLIPGSVGNNGSYNAQDSTCWRMRDTSLYEYGTNNGSNLEGSPFLASTKKYKSDGVLIDKLEDYYTKLPDGLKSYIVKKYHKVPIRQNSSSSATSYNLTDDTGTKWEDMGYLWLPYEKEVHGSNYFGGNYESHMKQYHSFANITDFKKKSDIKYGANNPRLWWVASAHSRSYRIFCYVDTSGSANGNAAYTWRVGTPLCFRFQ